MSVYTHSKKKNKYNLTPEQVAGLEGLTPKEKKAYLKKILKGKR